MSLNSTENRQKTLFLGRIFFLHLQDDVDGRQFQLFLFWKKFEKTCKTYGNNLKTLKGPFVFCRRKSLLVFLCYCICSILTVQLIYEGLTRVRTKISQAAGRGFNFCLITYFLVSLVFLGISCNTARRTTGFCCATYGLEYHHSLNFDGAIFKFDWWFSPFESKS